MIEFVGVKKGFGGRELFSDVNFTIAEGEHIGLVGSNGSGKSTLLKMIIGDEAADDGIIKIPKDYKVGYLKQHISFSKDNILDEASLEMPVQEDGTKQLHLAKAMLQGLGFSEDNFGDSPLLLSGGMQIRLQLAKLLLTFPDILLLDEPSNYLDIVSLRWLTKFLRGWRGELLLISHDREFVDAVTTHILGIHRAKIRKMRGKIDDYEAAIYEEELIHEQTRLNQERKIAQVERFIERFRYKSSKAKGVQSRVKSLAKLDRLEKLEEIKELDFSFRADPLEGKTAASISELSFGFDVPLIEDLSLTVHSRDRIGIIGRNGKGKTTLLRLIHGELTPTSGKISFAPKAKIGYFGQTNIERLNPELTVEDEIYSVDPLQAKSRVRGICGMMMFSEDDALKKVKVLSGGEKSRVLLGKLLAEPCNVLLLDEPTNHLDLSSTEALLDAAEEFAGAVLVVTHSEMILRRLVNKLVVFDGGRCFVFDGTYDEFLEKIGWQEEEQSRAKIEVSENNRREQRKQRVKQQEERNRVLKPLQKKVAELENEITADEEAIAVAEKKLTELCSGDFSSEIQELSKLIQDKKDAIDRAFEELEKAEAELRQKEAEFEELGN